MTNMKITVVRFPDGSWSHGGSPDDPDYAECDVWVIDDSIPRMAIRKAQARYRRWKVKQIREETP
ncbi:hypothetical protein [Paracoccus fontiphilus]|uniref:Uncharacterized protein n=1 Tax=Paracoccus fontiphilus TaxID=1815556 RepID=A0ABV7II89_9RHOB|nr:hypothetical protein [Paracoccus fontiphilus]